MDGWMLLILATPRAFTQPAVKSPCCTSRDHFTFSGSYHKKTTECTPSSSAWFNTKDTTYTNSAAIPEWDP